MSASPSDDFARLLEIASASAEALRAAAVAPESPLLEGWLVMQRLDRTEIVHAPTTGGAPHRFETFHEQIWLTADGSLRKALRVHSKGYDGLGDLPSGAVATSSDSLAPGAVICDPREIAESRWDGEYGPTSQREGQLETILQDTPCGPRQDSLARVAIALTNMTSLLVERRSRRPQPAGDDDCELVKGFAMGAAGAFLLAAMLALLPVGAVLLYVWFMGITSGDGLG